MPEIRDNKDIFYMKTWEGVNNLKKNIVIITILLSFFLFFTNMDSIAQVPDFKLGNEVLLEKHLELIKDKKVGLITNQSGVNSQGKSLIDIFWDHPEINLVALYSPEHGIDGVAKAGEYVETVIHPTLGISVYSLYGPTRMPNAKMLENIDILVFDMQDIGSRTYTYISTLNYCMKAAQEHNIPIVVLDRPNPVGGIIVEGPVMEEKYITFVGVDILPMAHGMTVGELALYFNRNIDADLTVVTMEGYTRDMLWQDTGLDWVQTSPNIPDLDSVFGYMATGIGEGTGIFQADQFKWIGGKGIDSEKYAQILNNANLPGVTFIPEVRGSAGGVRLSINDPYIFNPAKTGFYALAYAFTLGDFNVPKSTPGNIVMFDKIMGTDKIGNYLEQGLSPQEIEAKYTPALNEFKEKRKKYLIYDSSPKLGTVINSIGISVFVDGITVIFDSPPYIDNNNRLMVPLRAIAEAMNATVNWNPQTRVINISRGKDYIIFTIDSRDAMVNGETKVMDTAAVIIDSRTMVPVRYVGEFFNSNVNWDPIQKRVTIISSPV